MDLSTALIIPIFLYGIFLVLLGIEYITDKRKQQRPPPQEKKETPREPKKELPTAPLEDLEAEEKNEETSEAPAIWKEEEFE